MDTKSHFLQFNKKQRNGILYLIILILILQVSYYLIDFSTEKTYDLTTSEVQFFQKEIDSLKTIELEKRKPKIHSFNPNFLSDYKASKLGMTVNEIDRLFAFRKQNKYVNSAKEFQKITKISDSLLAKISPFFKFPEWVNKAKDYTKTTTYPNKNINQVTSFDLEKINGIGTILSNRIVKFRNTIGGFNSKSQILKVYGLKSEVINRMLQHYPLPKNNSNFNKKENISVKDINTATATDLQKINGIGEKLSARILKYRKKLGGFMFTDQLNEVYGLKPEVIQKLLKEFKILSKPKITKLNINEATFKQILHLPYIDYELTKKIFNYRDEFAEIQSLEELKKIEGFPIDKYDRIILYLSTE